MNAPRLILLRHGRPEGHEGRCVGHHDTSLSPEGAAEVEHLCVRWREHATRGPAQIVTSDLRRASDTARIVAQTWRLTPRADKRLREMSFGEWDGRFWDEIQGEHVRAWAADWVSLAPPGGESGDALARRVRESLDDLLHHTMRAPGDVLAVAHAGWIRVAATILLRESLASAFSRDIDYAHAAVFAIAGGTPTLSAWNVDDFFAAS